MRSYAVIPPALLDAKTRSRRFTNTNGLIEDPMQEYKDKQFLNLWTDQEKEIFKASLFIYLFIYIILSCFYLSSTTNNNTQISSNQQDNNSNLVQFIYSTGKVSSAS
jgi:amino acid permease